VQVFYLDIIFKKYSSYFQGPYYREWDKNFPQYEFSIIIYPGRGSRFGDKLITDIKEYVNQLDKGLLPYITKPCIFIGHRLNYFFIYLFI
jgi:surfactin synthase thioesterase subunit